MTTTAATIAQIAWYLHDSIAKQIPVQVVKWASALSYVKSVPQYLAVK